MVAGFHDCANNCRSIVLSILAEAPDRVFTLAELTEALVAGGIDPGGRPGKVVSDSLRTAVARGWVLRTGRGCYRLGRVPSTSLRRAGRRREGLRRGLRHRELSDYANWRLGKNPPTG